MTMPVSIAIFETFLDRGEIVLIIAVILILFAGRQIPKFIRGFRKGISQFGEACDDVAHDAGRSLGGIYGKPAAQALTPDNQTAEFYDPAVFHTHKEPRRAKLRRWFLRWFRKLETIWRGFFDWIKS
jgi:Sec-independent protein translocase protein TatA